MTKEKILITGANGQLGQALAALYPDAECVDRDTFDIGDPAIFLARDWRQYSMIVNAAAYTAVDAAETTDGRLEAWQANAVAPANLSLVATQNNLTLVHISSDYVFDGTEDDHTETEPFSPLGVYGQTKAAGDIAVALAPRHYVIRTSWVIGKGNNFVRMMKSLADKGVKPSVVNDQIGRLTFTEDLAGAIKHLTDTSAAYGTYNVSNSGDPASWSDIAKLVYEHAGHAADEVTGITTAQYYEGKDGIAPRPLRSSLDLSKLLATGFTPRDWREALSEYINQE
jgi:dTDP-4-dehydrorhamnose 3,5-epimerase